MAFIDPEFYQGSPLQEETDARAAAEELDVSILDEVVDEEVDEEIDEEIDEEVDEEVRRQNTRLDLDNSILRELQRLQQQNTQRAYLERQRRETE